MKEWALSFKSNRERPGDASADFQIGAPDISIPLTVVELACKENEDISNSPLVGSLGYHSDPTHSNRCNHGNIALYTSTSVTNVTSVTTVTIVTKATIQGYLTAFGYVKGIIKATCNDGEVVNKDVLVDSLQVYQKIANIKLTG